MAVLFVIANVWQNVEVMKIKLDHQKALQEKSDLIKKNDRLKYEIERYKRMDLVMKNAEILGMRESTPNDFETLIIKEH